jgi:hypothetical protein
MEIKQQIEKLKVTGQIFIWRFTDNDRNYPGWNFTVDSKASQDLLQLFDLMAKCDWSTKKSLRTDEPTDNELSVPNNRQGTAKWTTKPVVTFVVKSNGASDSWMTEEKKDELEITFSKGKLK